MNYGIFFPDCHKRMKTFKLSSVIRRITFRGVRFVLPW
jgi:hypothetical protein